MSNEENNVQCSKEDVIFEEESQKVKKDLLVRLRRIEGQVKGIERMVENGESCKNILVQVSAVRSAMNKVGGIMVHNYAKKCFKDDYQCLPEDKLEELISTLLMFTK